MRKKLVRFLLPFIFLPPILVLVFYVLLVFEGKRTYESESRSVNAMVQKYPSFFQETFQEIFPSVMLCSSAKQECTSNARRKFDLLSEQSLANTNQSMAPWSSIPSNLKPMYFILLADGDTIAKLFFSGDLLLERIDTTEERMVKEMLEGKRNSLYGPYLGEEIAIAENLKPRYLKDLYSQAEVIVPYYQDKKVVGAIVYLHGQ